jgi:GTP-binding protein Era
MTQRSGVVALLGRPNVGKSTLLNRIVDAPVAIVTHKPQTTRHRILGIHSDARGQAVFVDTPGLHRRRDHALNRRLNRIAAESSQGVDVLALVLDATHQNDEDELALAQVIRHEGPRLLVINKIDLLKDRSALLDMTQAWSARVDFDAVVYVSALKDDGIDDLLGDVFALLPEGEPLYDADHFTDRSERFLAAEMIREQLMLMLHQEIPYGLTVLIERFERTDRRIEIDALIVVTEDRHKGMVIGRQGQVLKRVGTRARARIAELLEERVHLNLHVKTRKGWVDDESSLDDLGYAR